MDVGIWSQLGLTVCAFITIGYAILKDKISNKQNDLKNTRSILRRREYIRNSNRYLQDLELNTVTYLKGFRWEEVEVLLDKNISLSTISNIRALKKENFLIIRSDEIIIPSKNYIFKKKLYKFKSLMISGSFVFSILLIIWSISHYSLSAIEYISMLTYMLLSEVIAIYYFDSLISFDLIIESGDLAGNDIVVSQDFDSELQP